MKVLIITYYWPPAGGSGVQRWLYFVKYLRNFGIEPIVFTVENPDYPILDTELIAQVPDNIEIITQKIWEPGNLFSKHSKKLAAGFLQEKPTLKQKLIRYVRANYFIPDARKFWIHSSSRILKKYLKTNPVDWIISTGPPHSVHLIAKNLHNKTGIKWLADFRDPWTNIDYFHQLPLSKASIRKHKELEKEVLQQATEVVVVSDEMAKEYRQITSNCHVISNGFDGEIGIKQQLDKPFTLTHIGLLNADRNPHIFWKALRELIDEQEEFEMQVQINLVGKIADEVKRSIRKYDLEKYINYTSYVSYKAVEQLQNKSQVLLLFVNKVPFAKGIVTGKVFEYLRAKRPILAIGPDNGDLAKIITNTKSGFISNFDDTEGLKKQIDTLFKWYLDKDLQVKSVGIEKYHRKNLTAELAKLLKK